MTCEERQQKTYHDIAHRLGLEGDLPYTENWSAAADFLAVISDYCLKEKPLTIVECSSGLTTLVLSRCCQLNRQGHVFSLENAQQYAAKTLSELENYLLLPYASVPHSPLRKIQIEQEDYQWYSLDKLNNEVEQIDMLVIDGPPGFIQRQSRYPALPLLMTKLADNASVFMDDAARDDERAIVDRWLNEFPSLGHRYYDTERGCSIISSRCVIPGIPDF